MSGGRVIRTVLLATALALASSACGLLPAAPPEWVQLRQPLPLCGVEDAAGTDPNQEARRCLLTAFQQSAPAELISTGTTVEGDPITRYIRVHRSQMVEIFVDATRDRFGSGTWERLLCQRLVPVEDVNDPPDLVFPDALVFVEEDCESLPVP